MHPNLDTRTAPRSMILGGFFINVMHKPTTRAYARRRLYGKKGEQEERENLPPLFGFSFFFFSVVLFVN